MGKKLNRIVNISVLSMIILFVVLCVFAVAFDSSGLKDISYYNQKINLKGTYSVDGGKEIPFSNKLNIGAEKKHKVIIKAKASEAINRNSLVILDINDLETKVKINGMELFEFGNRTKMFKSSGRLWTSFISPGISPDDEIEIEMKNYYENRNENYFNEFLNNLQSGSRYVIYMKMLKENGKYILISMAIIFIGLSGLVTTFCVKRIKNELNLKIRYYSLFTFCGGIWFIIERNHDYMSIIMPHIILNKVLSFGMLMFFPMSVIALFLAFLEDDKLKEKLKIFFLTATVINIIFIVEQIAGYKDLCEHRTIMVIVDDLLCVVGAVLLYMEIKKTKGKEQIILFVSFAPYFIFGFIDSIRAYFNIQSKHYLIGYGIMFVVFVQCAQLMYYVKTAIEAKKREESLKKELLNMKLDVMIHEIQPHFLYNSLTSISRLCDKDAKQAKKAINDLATYLRGNLASIKQTKPMPFINELNHIKKYVELEKIRFGDDLNVIYDIETENFCVPVLTIQPVIENAIKHGIGVKEEGGTVSLKTIETDENYEIIVADDGVGFDENEIKNDGKIHIGMENARRRLKHQCGGVIKVMSQKKQGTTVTIYIPKNK